MPKDIERAFESANEENSEVCESTNGSAEEIEIQQEESAVFSEEPAKEEELLLDEESDESDGGESMESDEPEETEGSEPKEIDEPAETDKEQSKISPLQLEYEEINLIISGRSMIRTFLNVNSLDLGVLTPNEYKYVARRSDLGAKLFERNLRKLLEVMPKVSAKRKDIESFTIKGYVLMLKKGTIAKMLYESLIKHSEIDPSKICVEFSSDLLFEETQEVISEIERIKGLGIKVMINGYGAKDCPMLKALELKADLLMLSKSISEDIEGNEEKIRAICNFAHTNDGVKVIAQNLSEEQEEMMFNMGLDGYTNGIKSAEVSDFEAGGETL